MRTTLWVIWNSIWDKVVRVYNKVVVIDDIDWNRKKRTKDTSHKGNPY